MVLIFEISCISTPFKNNSGGKKRTFSYIETVTFFAIWLRMLISFLNDEDIQLLSEFKNTFRKYHLVCSKNSLVFFGTCCILYRVCHFFWVKSNMKRSPLIIMCTDPIFDIKSWTKVILSGIKLQIYPIYPKTGGFKIHIEDLWI